MDVVGHESMDEVVVRGAALLMVGVAFIAVGINVLRMYERSILADAPRVMFWDILSVLFTGPWSFPVALAAMVMALGGLSAFFGAAVLVTRLF
jgi:hypothetical protein